MAGQFMFPDARFRSPTAVQGKADVRDENIFSGVVLAHGGAGVQKTFTVPQGQSIPSLKGSTITPAAAHHLLFTEATTNVSKAGEFGSSLGDASVRAIGLHLEQAPLLQDGSYDTWGASQQEYAEVAAKVYFQLKIGGKKQIEGRFDHFPAAQGLYGTLVTTATAAGRGLVNNSPLGQPRRLKLPILIARNDTVEGVVGVAGSASLTFRDTSGAGAESFLMVTMHSLVKGDVR